jgi:hypothetical protein
MHEYYQHMEDEGVLWIWQNMITSGDCTCMINWKCFYVSNVFLCFMVLSCNCVYVNYCTYVWRTLHLVG